MKKTDEKIEITKVVLKLHGKEIELTIYEAKELKKLLEATFEDTGREHYWYVYPHTTYSIPCTDYTITVGDTTGEISSGTLTVLNTNQSNIS